MSKNDLFKEGMNPLISYRYDIIDDLIVVLLHAIKRYNKHLKGSGKKVVFASTLEQVKHT
jgi:hypothetical protein